MNLAPAGLGDWISHARFAHHDGTAGDAVRRLQREPLLKAAAGPRRLGELGIEQ